MASTRILMGLNPEDFGWTLEAGEEFQLPEVVMVFSENGVGGMSRTFHKLYRQQSLPRRVEDEEAPDTRK